MNIRMILFDVGNVLVELGDASLIRNHSTTSFTDSYFWETWSTLQGVADFESGKTDPLAFADDVIDFYDLKLSPENFIEVFRGGAKRKFEGVDEFLSRLSNTYEIACLTNTNPIHWPKIRDDFELGSLFRKSYVSYEIGLLKPNASIFRHVLDDTHYEAQEILFVEDNVDNILSAKSLGFQCCHVKNFEDARSKIDDILKQTA
ncbi:MAG: hypothetical protein COB20_06065 [SAR86 cluster bacterium]|uniref:HAD family phosphatase n=1 Tax=SAR86 cluster bacterium TaxID=2030880 RepID=A0A2A4X8C0_9GAMM|nr:MAG: hypothetical protein COB20_06065 [SAR86 cluster bacterium]